MRAAAFICGLLLAGPTFFAGPARAQTFRADFGRWGGPPLTKTKFGVYQTPFLPPAIWVKMPPLLREAGVRDLRYEMAWGKPDAQAFDQIGGTASHPVIDFGLVDALAAIFQAADVHPLFAMTYDPLPLKTGDGWQRWKDVPDNLAAWGRINRAYASYLRRKPISGAPFYEVWNEPDLPGDGGKVFFNGGPSDYAEVYSAAQGGLRLGDQDASLGGPGIAYDTAYVSAALAHPMDFVSIHAYANYAAQISAVRPLLASHPDLPIFLTEYASYSEFGLTAPVSRAEGAARFFADVNGLLGFSDVTKVYWAQWADDSLGMLTNSLHRKALFNALKIYQTLLPVDRNPILPEKAGDVGVMASSDDHTAAVALWNTGAAPATVTVRLAHLPFPSGALAVTRIDKGHASFADDPASENLLVESRQAVTSGVSVWTGTLPAHGVVLLRVTDTTGKSLLAPASIGKFVRLRHWFPNRQAEGYTDYDPRTCIARLGQGQTASAVSEIGVVLDKPSPRLTVRVRCQRRAARRGDNALLGVRVDYETAQGWTRSALWHDSAASLRRTSKLPWGKSGAGIDKVTAVPALERGQGTFIMDIERNAPRGWNRRILLTPLLQNEGANAQVRLIFHPAPHADF